MVKFPNKKTITITKLDQKVKVIPYIKSNEKLALLDMMLSEENPVEARNTLDALVLQTHVEGLSLNSKDEGSEIVEVEVLDALRASESLTEVYKKGGLEKDVEDVWEMYLSSRNTEVFESLTKGINKALEEIKNSLTNFNSDEVVNQFNKQVVDLATNVTKLQNQFQ